MNCSTAETIRRRAEAALRREFGDDFFVEARNARFDASSVSLKFEVADLDESGDAVTKERKALDSVAEAIGLPSDAYGREFSSRGETYRVVGYNDRARKYPILAERVSDGAPFKFPIAVVRLRLSDSAFADLGGR